TRQRQEWPVAQTSGPSKRSNTNWPAIATREPSKRSNADAGASPLRGGAAIVIAIIFFVVRGLVSMNNVPTGSGNRIAPYSPLSPAFGENTRNGRFDLELLFRNRWPREILDRLAHEENLSREERLSTAAWIVRRFRVDLPAVVALPLLGLRPN